MEGRRGMKNTGRKNGKSNHIEGSEIQLKGNPKHGTSRFQKLPYTTGKAARADMAVALQRLEQEISERKRTEELLRESEERLKKILDSLDVGVAILDAKTHEILSINPKALALFGASAEQVLGKVCHQYICPSLKGQCPISDLGQTLDAAERILLTAAGTQIPVIKSVVRMKLRNQDCLVESFIDITARKQAEEALEKSLSLLQATFDSTADGILVVGRNGKVTTYNPKFLTLWRIPDSLAASHDDSQLLQYVLDQLQNPEVFMDKVKSLYSQPDLESYDVLEFKDGRVFERYSKPQKIGEEFGGRIWSFRDVTERRRAERELQISEEKYRLLIQNSNDAIFVAQDGVIKFPNFKTEKFLGYSAAELAVTPFVHHIHPDDRAMVIENHKKRLGGQNLPSTYSFRAKNKAGEDLWAEINAVRIVWEGKPATLNFVRDITEKKKLEVQFHQAQKMEAVGTLAGGLAHDFNNLLMGIQGHTSLVLLDMDPTHRHHKMLKSIEEQVKSGADLTWQLLSFARGGKYEVKPSDLNGIIKKTSDMFGRAKKEISIHKNLQQELWPVEVDRGQIEQVLINLYVNAWQAMPSGGSLFLETKNVILDESYVKPLNAKPGNYAKISVTDTGVGMDEKTRKRIFEPFFTTKEMGRGTGLGLATVYGIVTGHGGFINVYSQKGHGATFNIYLPASEKKVEKEKKSPGQLLKGKETILLVDDEEVVINVSRMILEALGYKVLLARSGPEAIEVYKAKKEEIDLAILDMIMPGMGGENTIDILKTINPELKVILSSGYSLNGQATRIMERGCQGFIQKPFGARELSQKVREVLDNHLKSENGPEKSVH